MSFGVQGGSIVISGTLVCDKLWIMTFLAMAMAIKPCGKVTAINNNNNYNNPSQSFRRLRSINNSCKFSQSYIAIALEPKSYNPKFTIDACA